MASVTQMNDGSEMAMSVTVDDPQKSAQKQQQRSELGKMGGCGTFSRYLLYELVRRQAVDVRQHPHRVLLQAAGTLAWMDEEAKFDAHSLTNGPLRDPKLAAS